MSAHVVSMHTAQCFDCGWEGVERVFFSEAETDVIQHNLNGCSDD